MILTAKFLLPLDAEYIINGAILIKDNFIRDIGPIEFISSRNPDEKIIDLKDAIIFPGFINAHTHLEYSNLRMSDTSVSFIEWLELIIKKARDLNYPDWKNSVLDGISRLRYSGITTIADISRSDASMELLPEAPFNAIIYKELVALDDSNFNLKVISESIEKNLNINKGRISVGISPHSVYTLSLNSLKNISDLAQKYMLPVMIHISETKEEMELIVKGTGSLGELMSKSGLKIEYGTNKTPVKILSENNLLGPNTIVVHGVHITDDDINLLSSTNTNVVLCPKSNEFLKTGYPPVKKIFKAGICPALGTDSLASNTSFNMFEEMRIVKKIYPDISYYDLLLTATSNGAKALNTFSSTGSLTPGKYADITAVKIKSDYNSLNLDPYEYICREADIDDISICLISGKTIY